MSPRPQFLVIGAQKSGTSWLARELRAHPEVFMPERKELHFFDRPPLRSKPIRFAVGDYERWFAEAPPSAVTGEATPAYLYRPYAARRIRALLPDVRMLVILREPAARAYSQWKMLAAHGLVDPSVPFIDAFHRDIPGRGDSIRRRGYYLEQLQRYWSRFPRERIAVLLYDDVVDRPEEVLRDAYRFVGVDDGFRSERFEQWHPTGYAGYDGVPDKLSPADRALLVEHYRDSVARLARAIGRDLSGWTSE